MAVNPAKRAKVEALIAEVFSKDVFMPHAAVMMKFGHKGTTTVVVQLLEYIRECHAELDELKGGSPK